MMMGGCCCTVGAGVVDGFPAFQIAPITPMMPTTPMEAIPISAPCVQRWLSAIALCMSDWLLAMSARSVAKSVRSSAKSVFVGRFLTASSRAATRASMPSLCGGSCDIPAPLPFLPDLSRLLESSIRKPPTPNPPPPRRQRRREVRGVGGASASAEFAAVLDHRCATKFPSDDDPEHRDEYYRVQ